MAQEVARGRGRVGLGLDHRGDVNTFQRRDAAVAVIAADAFEDSPILDLRSRGQVLERSRSEIADDHGADAAREDALSPDFDARRFRERLGIGVQKLGAAGQSGEGNAPQAGATEITVPCRGGRRTRGRI
jgi:hypothetical protein